MNQSLLASDLYQHRFQICANVLVLLENAAPHFFVQLLSFQFTRRFFFEQVADPLLEFCNLVVLLVTDLMQSRQLIQFFSFLLLSLHRLPHSVSNRRFVQSLVR